MGDLEKGLWGSNITASLEPTISHTFVTAMFKGDSGAAPGHMAIKGGNAAAGTLTVFYDGWRPSGYAPMKKQGSVVLGIGGDDSDGVRAARPAPPPPAHILPPAGFPRLPGLLTPPRTPTLLQAVGTFYEGALLKGFSLDAADAQLQADIVAAGYQL